MKNKTSSLKIGIGTPTILMIFVVLCMVISSVLSFMEANTNAKLSDKEITYVQSYYQADTQATLIQNVLINEKNIVKAEETYDIDIQETDTEYQYYVTIDEKKQLHVVLDKINPSIVNMWKVETKEDK